MLEFLKGLVGRGPDRGAHPYAVAGGARQGQRSKTRNKTKAARKHARASRRKNRR